MNLQKIFHPDYVKKSKKQFHQNILYDDRGSELFEQITLQPEYYPTRTEIEILDNYSKDIISHIQKEIVLIELGSGSSKKTKFLFDGILKKQEKLFYFPIDISFNFLNSVVYDIEIQFPKLLLKVFHMNILMA